MDDTYCPYCLHRMDKDELTDVKGGGKTYHCGGEKVYHRDNG